MRLGIRVIVKEVLFIIIIRDLYGKFVSVFFVVLDSVV